MNAIAFSLFGSATVYRHGLLKNLELAPVIYPGWQPYVWASEEIPKSILDAAEKAGARVIPYSSKTWPNGMFARFLVNDISGVERFISRDTDSRLNERESAAVAEWVKSGADLHLMRDHPYHRTEILGGLWGLRGGVVKNMEKLIKGFPAARKAYSREWTYGVDQDFLRTRVLPLAKGSVLSHDSCTRDAFPNSVPFPTKMTFGSWRFCGEVFDADDQPDPNHWQMRINWMIP